MKEDNQNPYELAARYFSGNASDAEVQQLESWVLSDAENKKQFLALQRSWNLANIKKEATQINVDAEWKSIVGKLKDTTNSTPDNVVTMKPKRSSATFLRMAAAVLLLIVSGLYFFNNNNATTSDLVIASERTIKEQKLKDGTQVDLNQFSTITYSDGADGTRQVALQGDAFFDVARDEERPFIIEADGVEVKVLGTSFYVDAREQQGETQVIVASGTVAMEVGEKKIILIKGEVGTYVKSNQQLTKKQNTDVNYMAWKTKRLVYEGVLLEKVIFDLERTFHTNITLEPAALKNCTLTATYDNQNLESVLRIIEKTLNLNTTTNGEHIVLSGSPCE